MVRILLWIHLPVIQFYVFDLLNTFFVSFLTKVQIFRHINILNSLCLINRKHACLSTGQYFPQQWVRAKSWPYDKFRHMLDEIFHLHNSYHICKSKNETKTLTCSILNINLIQVGIENSNHNACNEKKNILNVTLECWMSNTQSTTATIFQHTNVAGTIGKWWMNFSCSCHSLFVFIRSKIVCLKMLWFWLN